MFFVCFASSFRVLLCFVFFDYPWVLFFVGSEKNSKLFLFIRKFVLKFLIFAGEDETIVCEIVFLGVADSFDSANAIFIWLRYVQLKFGYFVLMIWAFWGRLKSVDAGVLSFSSVVVSRIFLSMRANFEVRRHFRVF